MKTPLGVKMVAAAIVLIGVAVFVMLSVPKSVLTVESSDL